MADEKFSGLCLGGPQDGKFRSSRSRHLRAYAETDPGDIDFSAPMPTEPEPVQTHDYQHVEFHYRNTDRPGWEARRGFWVDAAVIDPQLYVIDTLVKAYKATRHG